MVFRGGFFFYKTFWSKKKQFNPGKIVRSIYEVSKVVSFTIKKPTIPPQKRSKKGVFSGTAGSPKTPCCPPPVAQSSTSEVDSPVKKVSISMDTFSDDEDDYVLRRDGDESEGDGVDGDDGAHFDSSSEQGSGAE